MFERGRSSAQPIRRPWFSCLVASALVACGGSAERNRHDDGEASSAGGGSGGNNGAESSSRGSGGAGTDTGGTSASSGGTTASSGGGSSSSGGGTGGAGGTGGSGTGATGGGGTGGSGPNTRSIFVVEGREDLANETFFDHPWPSDMRLESGVVQLDGFPNPREILLLETYLDALSGRLDGFSPVATGYLRFTGPLDPESLPSDPPDSVEDDSSVRLIDIEPGSPDFGEAHPISISFREQAGVYVPANLLSFHPAFGQPLRPATRYALVVDDLVRDAAGDPVGQAEELAALLEGDISHDVYDEAIAELDDLGIAASDIVHLAVFTTTDPTRDAYAIRDWTVQNYPAPSALDAWSAEEQVDEYDVYEGRFGDLPDFQTGTPPFATEGGEFTFDDGGEPVLQREIDLRFALGVPDDGACPEPDDGYPVVLVAHGTNGDYRSAFAADHEATMFAGVCLATLSIDQLYHGERPGNAAPEQYYFALFNPLAARTNGPQSALDFVQLARLVREGNFAVPESVSRTGTEIHFDPDNVLFFGHSQGGLNGPILFAFDDEPRGGVFSGAGATISLALLQKTSPIDLAANIPALLDLEGPVADEPAESDEVDEFHPAISLVQTIADPSDSINYARAIIREPRSAFVAKSVLMTEGVTADGSGDTYAPPRGIESLAVAMGLPPEAPLIFDVTYAEWAGLDTVTVPSGGLAGNLAGGTASGVLAQFEPAMDRDGHFVVYDVDAARQKAAQFLRNLADEPSGRVPAP